MKATIKDGIVYSPYPKVEIPLCSVYTAMKQFLTDSPDQLAVIDDNLRLTRGEFLSRLRRFAAGFQAHGVGPGDRVCVHIGNSVENLVALFSITFTGASVLLSNPVLNENELLFQVDHADATHILTCSQWAEKVLAVQGKSKVRGLFLMDGDAAGFVSISNFVEINENDFKEVEIADPKDTTVALFYSSGTTGHAKGMEITHYSVVANLHQTMSLVSYDPDDVLLAWYPITYASGFMFTPVAACAGAVCVITSPGLTFDQLVHYVNKYQVTTLASVPTRIYYYVADMLRTGTKLPSVKKVNVGGTVLTRAFAEKIMAAFDGLRSLRNHYGMSESCGVICSPPNGDMASGNVGFPAPMVELKFIDMDTGEKVGPRQYGELYFRIPSVVKGYYKNPELTRQLKDDDGWCRSGDIMYYDEDGRVYFVDRVKDMIKCLDQQVSSVELESLLQSHRSVADAAVVGVEDTRYGDAPAAFVVLRNTSTASTEVAEQLKSLVADQTEKFKHLYGGVVFVDRLPRNANGKVIKLQLKAMYGKYKVY
uniref:Putative acyl-coa synthetase n=1 Tax=Amblyomma triste TaxID=251400 RepID=A0A023GNQ6_AMBTT